MMKCTIKITNNAGKKSTWYCSNMIAVQIVETMAVRKGYKADITFSHNGVDDGCIYYRGECYEK